jgi:chromate reductase, NAD(P)H dehydrogenase (quinone)
MICRILILKLIWIKLLLPTPWGGEYAHASLLLTLTMMDAKIVEGGTLTVPFIGLKLSKEGVITDPETKQALQFVVDALIRDILA